VHATVLSKATQIAETSGKPASERPRDFAAMGSGNWGNALMQRENSQEHTQLGALSELTRLAKHTLM